MGTKIHITYIYIIDIYKDVQVRDFKMRIASICQYGLYGPSRPIPGGSLVLPEYGIHVQLFVVIFASPGRVLSMIVAYVPVCAGHFLPMFCSPGYIISIMKMANKVEHHKSSSSASSSSASASSSSSSYVHIDVYNHV
jgi:hypothetical protein